MITYQTSMGSISRAGFSLKAISKNESWELKCEFKVTQKGAH